ncbi:MAG: DMT family transporter [Sciscionella sp.]
MSISMALFTAIGAAGTMAMASALQHRGAQDTPQVKTLQPRQVLRFARALLAQRLWLLALPFQVLGLVLHAIALHSGPLAEVQPLLTCSIVFALPLNHLLHGNRITSREFGWAVVLAIGLVGFLLAAAPVAAGIGRHNSFWPTATGLAVLVCGVLLVSRRATATVAAALLGIAAGTAYAAQAVFLQATTVVLAGGPVALLTSSAFYGLLAAGASGFVLTQLAFRAGPLASSMPAITITGPLLGVAFGVLIDNEHLRGSALSIVVETFGLLLLSCATIALARGAQSNHVPTEERPATAR